jgi:CHAT domain-containing protein
MLLATVSLLAALSTPRSADPRSAAATALRAAFAAPAGKWRELDTVRRRFDCVSVTGIRVESTSVDGSRATVRLEVAADQPSFPAYWVLRLRRDGSGWRLTAVDLPERALAAKIAAAPDEAHRRVLLEADPTLVTPELARRICEMGDGLVTHYMPQRADDLAALAREIAHDWNDTAGESRALWLLGRSLAVRNKIEPSRRAYEEGRDLAERAHDPHLLAATLLGIGAERIRTGEVDRTEELQEALRMARSLHDDRVAAEALYRLAFCDQNKGRYADALRKYDESVRLARRAGDRITEAAATADTGITYEYLNSHNLSFAYVRRGIALFRQAGNPHSVLLYLRNLADMEAWDLYTDDAEKHLREVAVLLRRYPDDRIQAFADATWATIALQRHDFAAAERVCTEGLALARKVAAKSLVTNFAEQLAEVRDQQHRYIEAAALAEEAIARSLTLTPSFDIYWHAKDDLGLALAGQGKVAEARRAFSDAIGAIEGTLTTAPPGRDDQQSFLTDKIAPYDEMFATFVNDRPEEAIRWAERERARILIELLASGKRAPARTLDATEQAEETAIQHGLANINVALSEERAKKAPDAGRIELLERDLSEKRIELAVFTRRLYEMHPDLALSRGDVPEASMDEIRAAIPPDGVALEYVMLDERCWLAALTHDGPPRIVPLVANTREIMRGVAQLRAQLVARDAGFRSVARRLYQILVEPAADVLRGKRIVCVLPANTLCDLPFQALIGGDGKYFIEHRSLFYSPSLAYLVWRANHPPSHQDGRRELLAFGNPRVAVQTAQQARARLRAEPVGSLPEAEEEVRALARIYGGGATICVGAAATEEEFKKKAPHYRLLHLATHGMYDDSDPMYSHLLLARRPGSADDGLLEARELAGLALDADLVVLSACETGLTGTWGHPGIAGLSWALLAAGTDTAVLTDLKVDSASSRDLMIAFHRRLARRPHDVAGRLATEALREAQVDMLRGGRADPFYWAAFFVIGRGW